MESSLDFEQIIEKWQDIFNYIFLNRNEVEAGSMNWADKISQLFEEFPEIKNVQPPWANLVEDMIYNIKILFLRLLHEKTRHKYANENEYDLKFISLKYVTILNIRKLVMVSNLEELGTKAFNDLQTMLVQGMIKHIIQYIDHQDTLDVIEAFENIIEETSEELEFKTLNDHLEEKEQADLFWTEFSNFLKTKWGYKSIWRIYGKDLEDNDSLKTAKKIIKDYFGGLKSKFWLISHFQISGGILQTEKGYIFIDKDEIESSSATIRDRFIMMYRILKSTEKLLTSFARDRFNDTNLNPQKSLVTELFGGTINTEYIGNDDSEFIQYINNQKNWKKDNVAEVLSTRFPSLVW